MLVVRGRERKGEGFGVAGQTRRGVGEEEGRREGGEFKMAE